VANSHENSFPAAPALWRPYFWDHPRIRMYQQILVKIPNMKHYKNCSGSRVPYGWMDGWMDRHM